MHTHYSYMFIIFFFYDVINQLFMHTTIVPRRKLQYSFYPCVPH